MRLANKIFIAAALAIAAHQARGQGVDVIRGQVLGPDGQPLENTKVTATSLSGNVNRTAHR